MWMVMLDFMYMGSADLFETGRSRKIQNENICFQRVSNKHDASPRQESQRLRPLIRYQVEHFLFNSILKWICDNTCMESEMQSSVNNYYTS